MNTRGIVQLKVISPVIFAMFVLMATILTFLTSPILSILYQRNADAKVLEESKTAHDLHLALEGETNPEKLKEDIITISTGQNGIMPQRQMSNTSMKPNSSVSMNHRPSYSRTLSNGEGDQPIEPPRRASRMTLF
jgi:hypothetical protein